ncbi:MAG: GGDEF domain-containing protein [Gammaproteobacteria bacterium]|nr:GGDEF domain-containing protein [Gammaproteobacteria bacterium]
MVDNVDKSLAEQLCINDREISVRKGMLEFEEYEIKYLIEAKPYISENLDTIVSLFYEKLLKNSEVSLVIGDKETLLRLKSAMRRYIIELFSGDYGTEYTSRRLRIGKVHKQIGVPPKLYLSAIWRLEDIISDVIANADEKRIHQSTKTKIKRSIRKLLMLDTQFVFDTYISSLVNEVQNAKHELQDYADSLQEMVDVRTKQLEEMSRLDGLTNLFNQKTLYEYLYRELNICERHREELSLVYFDLNNFKQINDTHGHQAGNQILIQTARSIQKNIREVDIPCRFGGDEFVIILPRAAEERAIEVMERVIHDFSNHVPYDVSFSIGITSVNLDNVPDADSLINSVDQLMYKSKEKSHQEPGFYITATDGPSKEVKSHFNGKKQSIKAIK